MGYVTDVDASLLNIGLQKSKGYDVDILYEQEFAAFDFSVDMSATYIDEQQQELFGQLDDYERHWGYPDWAADMDVRADWRDWTFFYNLSFIDKTWEPMVENRICETKAQLYHAASARYRGATWEVIGTVRNIANKKPPISTFPSCGWSNGCQS